MKIKSLILAAILFCLCSVTFSYGKDNLIIFGVVKDVDLRKGEIVLEVKTGACYGERTFIIDEKEIEKIKKIDDIVGTKMRFILNDSVCKTDEEQTIRLFPLKGGIRHEEKRK